MTLNVILIIQTPYSIANLKIPKNNNHWKQRVLAIISIQYFSLVAINIRPTWLNLKVVFLQVSESENWSNWSVWLYFIVIGHMDTLWKMSNSAGPEYTCIGWGHSRGVTHRSRGFFDHNFDKHKQNYLSSKLQGLIVPKY